jgi:tetratricopeptide (TPR) repeat protein
MHCDNVGDEIEALVASSLLRRTREADEPRYSMLESIREYGLRELSETGEAETARESHARWCLALAKRAAPELNESGQAHWLDRLEAELDNIRSALAWALEQPCAEFALALASALRRFWLARGYLVEGQDWLERALAKAGPADPAMRAQAMFAAGELAFFLEDVARARELAEEGLGICRSLGDASGAADALLGLGHLARGSGDLQGAEAYLREGIALAESVNDDKLLPMLQEALGHVAMEQGDLDVAEGFFRESFDRDQLAGDVRGQASTLTALGDLSSRRGDSTQAVAYHEAALRACANRERSGTTRTWGT